jgi:Tol biopolymer transport system component
MSLAAGNRLGPYEIVYPIGAGGMGEVYRARDTRLDRIVALKILPDVLAADPQFRERFDREARTISQLTHPHICTLYDVGEASSPESPASSLQFLVMEYLEGETLADRLAKGPLPLDQALTVAAEIAGALDKAHRAGIIHRDLKPGNVMLTKSGAKLLDFGLAKTNTAVANIGQTMLSTTPQSLTRHGTILGTVQYMTPEQLEGRDPDARADIFAFGAVLYEMLAGKKAFEGKSHASVIAAILEREPPALSVVQPLTPPSLDHVVERCLSKDPEQRWQNASDVRAELQWIATGGGKALDAIAVPSARWARWAAAAILLAAGFAPSLFVLGFLRQAAPVPEAIRFSIFPPDSTQFPPFPVAPYEAVSPDGRRVAFVAQRANSRAVLWVRSLDSLEALELPGTEDAQYPFWSPDSRAIGFFAGGVLRRIDAAGGPPQTICDAPGGQGGAWNREGIIIFGSRDGALKHVSAGGGVPGELTALDPSRQDISRAWPDFLPEGRRFTYIVRPSNVIHIGSFDSSEQKPLFEADSKALYASPGYVFFVRAGTLLRQAFDVSRMEVTGDPVTVAEQVRSNLEGGGAEFSVSANVLTYRAFGSWESSLTWFDRAGRRLDVLGDRAPYVNVRLSPDGERAAVSIHDSRRGTRDIWLYEVLRGLRTRFTFSSRLFEQSPVWSPDGLSVVFQSHSPSQMLRRKNSDGTGDAEALPVLPESSGAVFPDSWSADGQFLLYEKADPQTGWDLWVMPMSPVAKPRPFLNTPFQEEFGQFSPDGRWVAYKSNESGRGEVYVVPFPGPGAKRQVSTTGGDHPRWRRDGKEIFYLASDDRLMAAAVSPEGSRFEVGAVETLFETSRARIGVSPYDVSADGQRFLINTATEQINADPITVVVNWAPALTK